MNVLDVLKRTGSGLATVAGKAYEGYGQDQAIQVKDALARAKAAEESQRNAVLNALSTAQTNKLNAPAPHEFRVENGQRVDLTDNKAEPIAGYTAPAKPPEYRIEGGQRIDVNANKAEPIAGYVAPEKPAPPPNFSAQTIGGVDGQPGKVVTYDTHTGKPGPVLGDAKAAGGSSIPSGIRSKVAENTSTLATISEAMKSLDTHPDAVGLTKNLPLVGKYVDQRMDPEGVATRALIANVGSLQIHTRTGANMNIREEPRLAPFVPDASDTPEAIRTKLTQLAKFLKIENDALIGAPATATQAPPTAGRSGVPSFEDWLKSRGGTP